MHINNVNNCIALLEKHKNKDKKGESITITNKTVVTHLFPFLIHSYRLFLSLFLFLSLTFPNPNSINSSKTNKTV